MIKNKTVTILGGGIAGLTTAIALKKIGIDSEIFEGSAQLSPMGAGLGLGKNAIMAFDALGIKEEVCKRGKLLPDFAILDQVGKVIKQPTDITSMRSFDADNFTIHRADLHQFLLSKFASNKVHLGKRLQDFVIHPESIDLIFEDGTRHTTDYLIVAEGIHSVVRKKLIPTATPRYAGYSCWRAVIDDTLTVTKASETWGAKGRFGIVPLQNSKTYWFACINGSQNSEHFKNFGTNELLSNFKDYHHPIPEIISNTSDEQLIWNDILDLEPLNQFAFGRIILIGDAAHATTPNMGQGACQAIEDAVTLSQCMKKHTDIEQAFYAFEQLRLKRTAWVINTSRQVGKLAQMENRFLISLRNAALRMAPPTLERKQLKKIMEVSFDYQRIS